MKLKKFKGLLIKENSLVLKYEGDNFYLCIDKLSLVNNNDFFKIFFSYGQNCIENVDKFDIRYRRTTESFMFKLLNYIVSGIDKSKVFYNNELLDFELSVANKDKNGMFTLFKVNILNRQDIRHKLNIIAYHIDKFIQENSSFIESYMNACIFGEIPVLKETIEILDLNDFPIFQYEMNVKLKDQDEIFLEHSISNNNPYNISLYNSFVESRIKKIHLINVVLKRNMYISDFKKQNCINRFNSFFEYLGIEKLLEVPVNYNSSNNFNDENSIFKIQNSDQFQGNISVDSFLDIVKNLSKEELFKFVKCLNKA